MATFNEERYYGVEIEIRDWQVRQDGRQYHISMLQVARWINSIDGITCHSRGYTHDTTPYWKVVYDTTCGWEVVSPKLKGFEGLSQIRKVVKKLKAHGAVIDARCGLHVHHDASNLTPNAYVSVGMIYGRLQSAIEKLFLKPERHGSRDNIYCRTLGARRLGTLKKLARLSASPAFVAQAAEREFGGIFRYSTVNYLSYLRHGSIEFRQAHATLNPVEVTAWVVFTQLIVNKAEDVDDASTVNFMDMHNRLYENTNIAFNKVEPTGSMYRYTTDGRPSPEARAIYLNAVRWLASLNTKYGKQKYEVDCQFEMAAIDALVKVRDDEARM